MFASGTIPTVTITDRTPMLEATKIRIYPDGEQRQKLAVQFGCARWAYNRALALRSQLYKVEKLNITGYDTVKMLPSWKREFKWLKDADSQALQQSILNLDRAYKNFFAKRARFPKFKSRHAKQSIHYPQRVKLSGSTIYLPKVGWVKARFHRKIGGKIKTVTVSRSTTGKHYASVLTDDDTKLPSKVKSVEHIVGVDLGITDILTTSDGHKEDNPRYLRKAEKNLRRKQKSLSRKKKGSARRAKARLLVAKAHERVRNSRNDFQHKITRKLTDENQAVAVEDLAVRNMVKNRHLAKAISDAGWHSIRQKLGYKLERKGGHLVVVDRFFASSKRCSVCSKTNSQLKLAQRKWVCPSCGVLLDRELNAAENIRQEGVLKLKAEGLSVSAHRGLRKTEILSAVA